MQTRASFGLLLISRLYERVRCSYFEGDGDHVVSRDSKQLGICIYLYFRISFFFFINDFSLT